MNEWLQTAEEFFSSADDRTGFWIALTVLNVATFILYGWDKFCAIRGWRRVPERTLLGMALLGSAIGAWLGCFVFRHKVSKPSFMWPLIGVTVLNLAEVWAAIALLGK
ncbi:MAG: uncharacterized membrane protein YsdA (DUF1294 family) [Planctomycetota bacterium]|jgi:uncharacterized membrane protein YsdA (DUF1294 family)